LRDRGLYYNYFKIFFSRIVYCHCTNQVFIDDNQEITVYNLDVEDFGGYIKKFLVYILNQYFKLVKVETEMAFLRNVFIMSIVRLWT